MQAVGSELSLGCISLELAQTDFTSRLFLPDWVSKEGACSPVVPESCQRAIKRILESFRLSSFYLPTNGSVLSAKVQVDVLSFILRLEYTKMLCFLLSLFPSTLFIFCRKSSVSHPSLISLFSRQWICTLLNISMCSWQLTSVTKQRAGTDVRCSVCIYKICIYIHNVYIISQF